MLIRTEFFFFEVNVEKKASLNENFTSMNFSRLLIHQGFNGPRVKYVENFLRTTNEKKKRSQQCQQSSPKKFKNILSANDSIVRSSFITSIAIKYSYEETKEKKIV